MPDNFKLPYPRPGDPIRASDIGNISRNLAGLLQADRGERISSRAIGGMKFTRGLEQSIYNIVVYNASESTIPAYGVIRQSSSGALSDEDSRIFIGGMPNAFGSQFTHIINGPEAIESGDYGMATNTFPCPVAVDYSLDSSITYGSEVGPRSGDFIARALTGGFRVVAQPTDEDMDEDIAFVVRNPFIGTWCKPTGAISLNTSGSCLVYWGLPGFMTSTGETISVYAANISNIDADVFVWAEWKGSENRWDAIQAPCPV